MRWVEKAITKEQYEEGTHYTDIKDYANRKRLAEEIAGMNIVCGYGLYGYDFQKRIIDGEEKYILSMRIGNSCD